MIILINSFFSLNIFIYIIIISLFSTLIKSDTYSDSVMKTKDFIAMENKAKAFACSLLANSNILSKKREKKIREFLKKNNYDTSHEKIIDFKIAICYNNIYTNKANDILISLNDGKYDFINDKSNSKFFDFDTKTDFNILIKDLEFTKNLMKELEKEEKDLHDKRKDDKNLDKDLKDIEKKLIRNPKFIKGKNNNIDDKDINFDDIKDINDLKDLTYKKRKIKGNKDNNNKFQKFNQDNNNNDEKKREFNIKEIIKNPELLTEYMGIKTAIGFIIFMIILSYFDAKNQKRWKEEEELKKKMEENKNNNNENKDNNKNNNNKDNDNNNNDDANKEKKE